MAKGMNGYGAQVVRNRWLIILLSLLFTAFAAYGTRFLDVNPDARVFFSDDNPHLIALESLENTFTKNDNVLVALAPKDGEVFSRETLAAISWLTEEGWQIPYSSRVESIVNYPYTRAEGDDLVVSDLVEAPDALSDTEIAAVRAVALSRPELVNRLVSDRGHVAGVNIHVILPGEYIHEVDEVAAAARQLVAEFRDRFPEIDVYLTGGIMVSMAYSEVPEQDIATLFPIMFALIVVILLVSLRSLLAVATTMLLVVMAVVGALGLAGWAGVVLNAGTMSAPIIILTLSIAHCVHILVTMIDEMRRGREKRAAIAESLRVNLAPVFITTATTAIGFLTMNFSDAPPFRLLGNIVATGMLIAFILAVTFLPAMMAVLPVKVKPLADFQRPRLMDRVADFVIAYRNRLFWGMAVTIVVLAAGIPRIVLDDDFIKYFDERHSFRTDSDFVLDNLTAMNMIEYAVPAGEEGGISDPEYLHRLDAFAEWLQAQPDVVTVLSLATVVKRLNANMHGDDPAYYRIPDSRELAAQYLLLYELSLPFGLDLNNQIDVAKSSTRVTALIHPATSRSLRELDARAQQWLAENAPEQQAHGTGLSLVFAHISERNINAMLGGSIAALALISMILIIALRSVRIGFISLVPNLFPAAMAFGLWGYMVGEVGLGIAVVLAMTLGIIVDDTVHFLSKYLRARREHGLDSIAATRYAFRTVGMALWVTSLALVCGFGVLAFSGFKVNADMGLLSALTIALALAADFLFLAPLLMKLDARPVKVAATATPAENTANIRP